MSGLPDGVASGALATPASAFAGVIPADAARIALRPRLRGLYAVTPESLRGADLLAATAAAIAGGATVVQYRAKHDDADQRRADAHALAALCRRAGALFFVNDAPELAIAVGADGVHLGRDDGPIAELRAAHPGLLIGASCYDEPERARAAAEAGADYLAFGAVFTSSTKPAAVRAPLALFEQARALGLPLAAIGGIALDNAPRVIAAGADMLAVVSDLFAAPDIRARAAEFAALWK